MAENLGSITQSWEAMKLARSSFYRTSRASLEKKILHKEIISLSQKHPRDGYRRITALWRREGNEVNAKRVQRVRRMEGMQVRRKQCRPRRLGLSIGERQRAMMRPKRGNNFNLTPGFTFLVAFAIFAPWNLARVTEASASPRAAVFDDALPGFEKNLAREVAVQVSDAGYTVEFINVGALTNETSLSSRKFALLVLPGARSLPAAAAPAIENFLSGGSDLLALGLPAWDSESFELNGHWISRADYERTIASQRPRHLIADFATSDVSLWTRAANDFSAPAHYELADAGRGKALHVVIEKLSGWETFGSPTLTNAFPRNYTLTCFRAKGSPRTRQLALEWMEDDGSRWIATVDLTTNWQQYALQPDAFKPWQPPPGRGDRSDRLRVHKAVKIGFGLAQSHTAVEGSRHEYWFADLGTAPDPFGNAKVPEHFKLSHIENFSPSYLFYPINAGQASRLSIERVFPPASPNEHARKFSLPTRAGEMPDLLYGIHPRPRGVGFDQQRPWRWQPLLVARDRDGDYRGAIAALLVHSQGTVRGGAWAGFTPAEADFYRQPQVKRALQEVLVTMRRGIYLHEGGAEFFTVFDDQTFRLGARAENFGQAAQSNLVVRLSVRSKSTGETVHAKEWNISLPAGAEKSVEETWKPRQWPKNGFEVTTELLLNGKVIDHLSHELNVWRPKPKPEFIETRDGGFWRRGKPWKVNGVNYMPSTGIGVESAHFFEHWVCRGSYDPEVIERDLERIKAMNLNAVSVFIHHESLKTQNLLDFLRRCEALGLRVNQSLRPGTPLDFRWNEMKELIEFYRLAQNDTVFAYDLAWEPSHGDHAHQQQTYSARWNQWVVKRYGSVAAAENAWEVPAPRENPVATSLAVPPISQLTQDGSWRKLVADYRQFLDELLGANYAEARRLVKSIDSHHAVSFRMSEAGNPTLNWDAFLPYDFYGLADAVDIWEPEAYGRIGDWESVKPGRFTADYARLCDARKPVRWAEMGYTVWDRASMKPNPEKLQFAARYFADFYRMLGESGADGVFFWWYAGGYRLDERSDFGIINPDGTDRPVTKIIRTEGARFLKSRQSKWKPNYWISVDRDRDARGLFGIYEAVKDEYWRVIAAGKQPGLKWAKKPSAPANTTP